MSSQVVRLVARGHVADAWRSLTAPLAGSSWRSRCSWNSPVARLANSIKAARTRSPCNEDRRQKRQFRLPWDTPAAPKRPKMLPGQQTWQSRTSRGSWITFPSAAFKPSRTKVTCNNGPLPQRDSGHVGNPQPSLAWLLFFRSGDSPRATLQLRRHRCPKWRVSASCVLSRLPRRGPASTVDLRRFDQLFRQVFVVFVLRQL